MTIIAKRNWRLAIDGLLRLRKNHNNLPAVMDIIQGLDGPNIWQTYRRMLKSSVGRELLLEQKELSPKLMDDAWLEQFDTNSLGYCYRQFVGPRQINAQNMQRHMAEGPNGHDIKKSGPVPWFSRRIADLHDVAHTLTGYDIDPQGEGCLMAWTYAQLGGWGYLAIALGSAFAFGPLPIIEAWWLGRKAKWLFDLDAEAAFHMPIRHVRDLLCIGVPRYYMPRRCLA